MVILRKLSLTQKIAYVSIHVTLILDYSEDCSPGVCFEGACEGDTVYTTTGQCGRQHGNRACAGVWGSCCNAAGQCGNGTAFCAYGACQQGNCTIPAVAPSLPVVSSSHLLEAFIGGPVSLDHTSPIELEADV